MVRIVPLCDCILTDKPCRNQALHLLLPGPCRHFTVQDPISEEGFETSGSVNADASSLSFGVVLSITGAKRKTAVITMATAEMFQV